MPFFTKYWLLSKPHLIFILLIISTLLGFSQNYQVHHWSLKDGLSNSIITGMIQAQDGQLWISTEHGLNAFDGYSFTNYRYDPFDSASIGANYISDVFEAPDGNIWATLSVGGISKWDCATEKFSYYSSGKAQREGNNGVQSLFWDEEGELFVGTYAGLNTVNEANRTFNFIGADSIYISVRMIKSANKEYLWLICQQRLFLFHKATQTFQWVKYAYQDSLYPMNIRVTFTHKDRKGRQWFGTTNGVFYYDEVEGHLKLSLEYIDGKEEQQFVTGLFEDQNGKLWVSFWAQGLYYFDEGLQKFIQHPQPPTDLIRYAFPDSVAGIWVLLSDDRMLHWQNDSWEAVILEKAMDKSLQFQEALTDHNGNIWFGTRGEGLYYVYPEIHDFGKRQDLELAAASNGHLRFVQAILEDRSGTLWIGTKNGLWQQSRGTPSLKLIQREAHKQNTLMNNYIGALMEDRQGNLWISCGDGISRWDQRKQKFTNFHHSPDDSTSLSHHYASHIMEDTQGRIWITTNNGLNLFDAEKQQFRQFFKEGKSANSLSGDNIRMLIQTDTNEFYVAHVANGLTHLHYFPEADSIAGQAHFFHDHHETSEELMTINTLYLDHRKRLWAGTFSRGLLEFDRVNNQFVSYEKKLPLIPNIAGILEDDAGNLWISSNLGLWKFNPISLEYQHFADSEKLQSLQFNIGASAKGKNGKMYFGGTNGINDFYPEKIAEMPLPASPILTLFKKYDQQVFFEKPLDEITLIELRHTDDFITFEFCSIDFARPDAIQYAYRLRGFNEDWIDNGKHRTVSYTNLPSGTYTFEVKAGNREGNWNPAMAAVQLIIAPPFWETTWFYLLLAGILIGLGFLVQYIRWRIKLERIKEIARIREKAAADFHDELGHRLTRIALFTETIFRRYPSVNGEIRTYLTKIQDNSNELYHSLRDFVWAMNPKKDSVFELAILLKDFGDDLFDNTHVQFRVEGIEPPLKKVNLNMDWKRHLVLIFKEAMNNALKHAGCPNVTLVFNLRKDTLKIELLDDGKGFQIDEKRQGYGLGNMQTRAKKLGGCLEILNANPQGTKISFTGILTNTTIPK